MSILEPTMEVENMYPDVRVRTRWMTLACNIYLFLAICAEAVLVYIDFHLESQIWWSVLLGLGMLYVYLVLRYAVLGKSGYRSKIITLSILAVLAAVGADMAIGYRGWSVDYVLPAGILAVDVVILFLMYFNRRNWQSYMIWQIFMILCSLIPAGLYLLELEQNVYLALLPLIVSGIIFLGTFIIGSRRARTELYRRFHI
jgi:hypothetical protein